MIRAIIFDCFGVIVGKGFWQLYEEAGGDLQKDAAFIEDVLKKANSGQITRDAFTEAVAARLGIPVNVWKMVVDSGETPNLPLLEYIRDELKPHYKIALLSNANKGSVQRRIPAEWLQLFDEVTVSAEVGLLKPDPEIFYYSTRKLDVPPEEAIFTDDREQYLHGAAKTGMKTLLYKDLNQFKVELSQLLETDK